MSSDDFLDNSRLVEVYANKAENNFTYRLFFSKFEDAKKFYKEKINNSEIDSIKLMNE